MTKLDLSDNLLVTLLDGTFNNMIKLKSIDLENNLIQDIGRNAFE